MKKIPLLFALLFLVANSFAQKDTSLYNRLSLYNKYNKELNFEKLMDFIRPSLFEVAPRETLIETFQNIYNNEEMSITLDTIDTKEPSADFFLKGVQYRKVDYHMSMGMKFKKLADKESDTSFMNYMVSTIQQSLLSKKVSYDINAKVIRVTGREV